jgi:fumarate hydratase subunit alpha
MGSFVDLKEAVSRLSEKVLTVAATDLPPAMVKALGEADGRERVPAAKAQLETILTNINISKQKCNSICQDPGIPVFDVKIGSKFPLDFDIEAILTKVTADVTKNVPLRQNICHPLTKVNTKTNTGYNLPYIFYKYLYGVDYLEITGMLRGGGSAFRSGVYSLAPTAPRLEGIKKLVFDHVAMAGGIPCPPTVVGVGLGGTPDIALYLAFEALRRSPVGGSHPDADMAKLEEALFVELNKTGIGTMGLGGDTTVLGVHIEYVGSHIATHPVAIAFSCWPNRYATARLYADGRVEWITHEQEVAK